MVASRVLLLWLDASRCGDSTTPVAAPNAAGMKQLLPPAAHRCALEGVVQPLPVWLAPLGVCAALLPLRANACCSSPGDVTARRGVLQPLPHTPTKLPPPCAEPSPPLLPS
jgi:hypothetical protein